MRYAKRELKTNDVVVRMEQIMKEKSISQRKLMLDLKLSSTSFTRWKYEGSKSYLRYIKQIADYLDVSVNFLLYGEEKLTISDLSPQEVDLIKSFRSMTKNQQCNILEISNALTYFDESKKVLS